MSSVRREEFRPKDASSAHRRTFRKKAPSLLKLVYKIKYYFTPFILLDIFEYAKLHEREILPKIPVVALEIRKNDYR